MDNYDAMLEVPLAPPHAAVAPPAQPNQSADFVNAWQKGLLPFMTKMLVGLALVFFIASFVQLYYLYDRINAVPALDLRPAFGRLDAARAPGTGLASPEDALAASRWETLATLEGVAVQRRYHQANVSLLSRVWITYLGFITGMMLAIVGATFVLGKLQEPESQLQAAGAGASLSLKTASPGLFLAALGSGLMFTTMVTHNRIDVLDQPTYINEWAGTPLLLPTEGTPSAGDRNADSPLGAPPQLPRDTSRHAALGQDIIQ